MIHIWIWKPVLFLFHFSDECGWLDAWPNMGLEWNWFVFSGQWGKKQAQVFEREIKPVQAGCVISSLILSQRNRNEEKTNTEKSLGLEGGVWGVAGQE